MVLEARQGGCWRLVAYTPHPAHIFYNSSTSANECMVLDSVISFYLWLLNEEYREDVFTKLAGEQRTDPSTF